MADIGAFAGIAVALYAAHHVGDYWVQTDHQAQHKGAEGKIGRRACRTHVLSYLLTQSLFMLAVEIVTDFRVTTVGAFLALFVSGVTHYVADRREHGLMFKLARRLPGKARFLMLGVPRESVHLVSHTNGEWSGDAALVHDNPSLGTGAWALDQSWHIFWGVFVAGLVAVSV